MPHQDTSSCLQGRNRGQSKRGCLRPTNRGGRVHPVRGSQLRASAASLRQSETSGCYQRPIRLSNQEFREFFGEEVVALSLQASGVLLKCLRVPRGWCRERISGGLLRVPFAPFCVFADSLSKAVSEKQRHTLSGGRASRGRKGFRPGILHQPRRERGAVLLSVGRESGIARGLRPQYDVRGTARRVSRQGKGNDRALLAKRMLVLGRDWNHLPVPANKAKCLACGTINGSSATVIKGPSRRREASDRRERFLRRLYLRLAD